MNNTQWLDEVKFNEQGLILQALLNIIKPTYFDGGVDERESLALTAEKKSGGVFLASPKLWHKGEESGHFQTVYEIRLDCDGDVIILQVEQHGGIACHTGRESCFYRKLTPQGWEIVDAQLKTLLQFMAIKPKLKATIMLTRKNKWMYLLT